MPRRASCCKVLTGSIQTVTQTIVRGLLRDKLRQNVAVQKKRRGGWHPQPRQFELYHVPEAASPHCRWEHDSSRSTVWLYLDAPNTPYWDIVFRQEFGIARSVFDAYLRTLQGVDGFRDKVTADGNKGRRSKPLRLKLAVYFLTLREGLTFKRAARHGCFDDGMFRRFFHKLNEWMVANEYKKHVFMPEDEELIKRTENMFSKMGFPGAITTYDAVHAYWSNCPAMDHWLCNGKEGYPTRVWNCAVGPWKEFCHITPSHPGARNDITRPSLVWIRACWA